jgi:hypothetical protein
MKRFMASLSDSRCVVVFSLIDRTPILRTLVPDTSEQFVALEEYGKPDWTA